MHAGGTVHWRNTVLRNIVVRVLTISVVLTSNFVAADMSVAQDPVSSTNSRSAREMAVRSLPMEQLTAEAREKIDRVVSRPAFYRRIVKKRMECDADLFIFLTRHPEVVVNIWDLMGITKIDVSRTGPHTFSTHDGQGTKSEIELIYGTHDTHLFFAHSEYDGPLLARPVRGRCVLLLKTDISTETGREYVTNQLDVFVRLDRIGAELVTKTLHPIVGHAADHNFSESTSFVARLSRTAQANGPGVQRLAQRLTEVDPEVRKQFAQLTASISDRNAERIASMEPNSAPSFSTPETGETVNHSASRARPAPRTRRRFSRLRR